MQAVGFAYMNCTFVAANSIQLQLSLVSRSGSHINHRQSPPFTHESMRRRFLSSLYISGIIKDLSSQCFLLEHYLWAIRIPLFASRRYTLQWISPVLHFPSLTLVRHPCSHLHVGTSTQTPHGGRRKRQLSARATGSHTKTVSYSYILMKIARCRKLRR